MTLRYKRSGILNQKEHGVNLSATVEKKFSMDHESRQKGNSYGSQSASVSLSRSITDEFSVSGTLIATINDRIRKKEAEASSHSYLLITSQAYSFTDKLSLGFTQYWSNGHKKNNGEIANSGDNAGKRITESFSVSGELELGYQITSQVSASLFAGFPITKGHDSVANDGNFFVKNIQDKYEIGGSVYVSAF